MAALGARVCGLRCCVVAASREATPPHAVLLACIGRRVRRRRGDLDDLAYGGPLTTGYQPGEVTSALGAIRPNLRLMPAQLMRAMPMLVLGLIALAWIVVRWLVLHRAGGQTGAAARRDLSVGLALAASWFAIWGLYATYTWTTDPSGVTVQVVRFYLPALGAASLLGAWLVTRIPDRGWRAGLTSTAVIAATPDRA